MKTTVRGDNCLFLLEAVFDEGFCRKEGVFVKYRGEEITSLEKFNKIPDGQFFQLFCASESGYIISYIGRFKKIKSN